MNKIIITLVMFLAVTLMMPVMLADLVVDEGVLTQEEDIREAARIAGYHPVLYTDVIASLNENINNRTISIEATRVSFVNPIHHLMPVNLSFSGRLNTNFIHASTFTTTGLTRNVTLNNLGLHGLGGILNVGTDTSNQLRFKTGGSNRIQIAGDTGDVMVINNLGVGSGSLWPTNTLDVHGDTVLRGNVIIDLS